MIQGIFLDSGLFGSSEHPCCKRPTPRLGSKSAGRASVGQFRVLSVESSRALEFNQDIYIYVYL